MSEMLKSLLQVELASTTQREELDKVACERNWGLALVLVGWLHLVAFLFCYYMTIACEYHGAPGYLATWGGELLGMALIFRWTGGRRPAELRVGALELFIRRVWIAYFILAFNLLSLNTLEGHYLFQLFPAMASLASFALILMSVVIDWRFFAAVLVMFGAGLLMAAHLLHAFLFFALAWWVVLNGIGLPLLASRRAAVRTSAAAQCLAADQVSI